MCDPAYVVVEGEQRPRDCVAFQFQKWWKLFVVHRKFLLRFFGRLRESVEAGTWRNELEFGVVMATPYPSLQCSDCKRPRFRECPQRPSGRSRGHHEASWRSWLRRWRRAPCAGLRWLLRIDMMVLCSFSDDDFYPKITESESLR